MGSERVEVHGATILAFCFGEATPGQQSVTQPGVTDR